MGSSPSKVTASTNVNLRKANADHFRTYDELTVSLRACGLESMQMVVGIDFSRSNTWTGEHSYGRSLHDTSVETPYERCLRIIAPVMKEFDDDGVFPVYRFGCIDTRDASVLPLLYPQVQDPHFVGFEGISAGYRQAVPLVTLSGPTTLAPIIRQAIEVCKSYKNELIILFVLTDGDMSDPKRDEQAIIEASNYPIAITVLGIGDGPFDTMVQFDDKIRGRKFDNFQFANFTAMEKKFARMENPELELATHVFMELPLQYLAMKKLGYLH